jgi:hypothetical protein
MISVLSTPFSDLTFVSLKALRLFGDAERIKCFRNEI